MSGGANGLQHQRIGFIAVQQGFDPVPAHQRRASQAVSEPTKGHESFETLGEQSVGQPLLGDLLPLLDPGRLRTQPVRPALDAVDSEQDVEAGAQEGH